MVKSVYLPQLAATAMTGWRHSKGSSNIGLGDSSSNSSTHGTVGVLSLQWLLFDFGGRQARAGRRTGDHRRQRRPDRRAPATGPGSQRRLPRLYRGARAPSTRARAWSTPAPCWMPPTRATGRPGHRGRGGAGDPEPRAGPAGHRHRRQRRAGRLSGADHRHGHLAAGAAAHRHAARSRAVARAGAAGRTDHHRRAGAPPDVLAAYGRAGRTGQGARGGLGLPAQGLPVRVDLAPRGARPSPPCPPSASRPAPSTWTAAVPAPASSWA